MSSHLSENRSSENLLAISITTKGNTRTNPMATGAKIHAISKLIILILQIRSREPKRRLVNKQNQHHETHHRDGLPHTILRSRPQDCVQSNITRFHTSSPSQRDSFALKISRSLALDRHSIYRSHHPDTLTRGFLVSS